MHPTKALFLKQPGILSKVFIILIALFLRFSQIILPALTYAFRRRTRSRWRSRAFARQCYRCPSTARSCGGGYIFYRYSCEDQHFPATPARDTRTDIDLRYLGHIFVVAERFFQLNADEAGEPSSVAVRNDDNPPCLFVRSEARMLSSVVLPLNSALRRSSSPASPTDANTNFHLPSSFYG